MARYNLKPRDVASVRTAHRSVQGQLPVPESLPLFETLSRTEPVSMMGQPPVVWHRATGFTVEDPWGNRWIDWSSGVLVANVGHAHPAILQAVREAIDQELLCTYVFTHQRRADLCAALQQTMPKPVDRWRVFLLTTGSEAVECCIKLARTYAQARGGGCKRTIVSFTNAFHGRTLGAQLAGGTPALKAWIGHPTDTGFVQVPFPDGWFETDVSFERFLSALHAQNVHPEQIAGVLVESYQGAGPFFLPDAYARTLERCCRDHDILLICDEVQSGFGRTGRMFCFEHYGICPDLVACGKGISSSLPLSAVIGRADVMNLYPPGSMTSTHSASPLPVAAGLASLKVLHDERLCEHAADMGELLRAGLTGVVERSSPRLGALNARGLVAGIYAFQPDGQTLDPDLALRINTACYERGVLMFAPVGMQGACIKIAPPLCITREALEESLEVFAEAAMTCM